MRGLQLPSSLRLEPMQLFTGNTVEVAAGASLPNTNVIIMSGQGKKMTNSKVAGKKQTFTVVQRLWRLDSPSGVLCSSLT